MESLKLYSASSNSYYRELYKLHLARALREALYALYIILRSLY